VGIYKLKKMDRIQIINKLVLKYGFEKYLEIGVRNPEDCFNQIFCKSKDDVDPGYEYDSYQAKYPFTSNDFFSRLESNLLPITPDYKWDVIFIDGLHLSYQVEMDILNSLNHLSDTGFIVLHDTDPFLYENNYKRLLEAPSEDSAWNGTVWKSIYKIRATRSDLKVCTLKLDQGVSIISRGNSKLIPFDNPFFEYTLFLKNRERDLNLINYHELDFWLDQR